ncbi:hypothetical protein B0181_01550 [Moraxella caviae]|uniref:Uncharacterized protein n=1 Tax=Moraxella caviae TaxID=34060 RepID=A0A1T0AAD6_9GAMM|nr:hypothetical protein [Moraxella caviae]OOR92663.1 hypothetical protein B0181_01550 [Moraxella caviae]STZ14414.1 Uncharacterised protein [Moraxella caviae]VEW10499.1 Uncharacterised protein [Moraxella caviae]
MDKDFALEYQDFEFSRQEHITPKTVRTFQANAAKSKFSGLLSANFFDDDVITALNQHNNEHDRQRVNTVLRALFATG